MVRSPIFMELERVEVRGWTWAQLKLFAILGVATFFEGFDLLALTQILPSVRQEFGLSPAQAGFMVGVVNVGTTLSYFLVRAADRVGRRPIMLFTVLGYAVFSALSGLAPGAPTFTISQLAARVFLIAEWGLSTIYAAEEFPARSRGVAIGILQGLSSLGAVVCAAVVPSLLESRWGWRSVYFVGTIPLLILIYARRGLQDTHRFLSGETRRRQAKGRSILSTTHARRVWILAAIWALTYAGTQAAIMFWKEFAVSERGFSDADVGASISIAAIGSMPLVFAVGYLIDRIGRRLGACFVFLSTAIGVFGSFALTDRVHLTVSLVFSLFGASAVLPIMNAYTTELFPTEYRGQAFAWCNTFLGRAGYIGAPLVVGYWAGIVGWGQAVRFTALLPVLALGLILAFLPETKGLELEESVQAE